MGSHHRLQGLVQGLWTRRVWLRVRSYLFGLLWLSVFEVARALGLTLTAFWTFFGLWYIVGGLYGLVRAGPLVRNSRLEGLGPAMVGVFILSATHLPAGGSKVAVLLLEGILAAALFVWPLWRESRKNDNVRWLDILRESQGSADA